MCQQCYERLKSVQTPLVEALEKYRHEITQLSQRIGRDISQHIIEPELREDIEITAEHLQMLENHMGMVSLAFAVGYTATSNDHDHQTITELGQLFNESLLIGHWKSGSDQFQRQLN